MFRTLIYPSSGACDYAVDYHIGRFVLVSLCVGGLVQLGLRTAPNLQHTANQEKNDQYGNSTA